MTPSRRTFLRFAAGATVLPALSRRACGQVYPSRSVHVVVPFPPGGSTDMTARLISERLGHRLGQPFVVENRPGAGTNIATESVVRAAPDGYTLLLITPPSAINATLYDSLKFNFLRDIAPIAGLIRAPFVLVINSSVPAATIPEFIAYAKAQPAGMSMASSGIGSGPHVTGELFKMAAGIDMVHVPYRGATPALTDLLAGQVQVFFASAPEVIAYVKAGKVRVLAVTTAMRSPVLPDVPTLSEFFPGFEASYWVGLGAPKNTPTQIVDALNAEINAALAESSIQARFADLGGTTIAGSPGDFGKLIADDTDKWGKVIRAAHIRPE